MGVRLALWFCTCGLKPSGLDCLMLYRLKVDRRSSLPSGAVGGGKEKDERRSGEAWQDGKSEDSDVLRAPRWQNNNTLSSHASGSLKFAFPNHDSLVNKANARITNPPH